MFDSTCKFLTEHFSSDFAACLEDQAGKEIYVAKRSVDSTQIAVEITVSDRPASVSVDGDYVLPSAFPALYF